MKTMAEFRRRLQQAKELGGPQIRITTYNRDGTEHHASTVRTVRSISQRELTTHYPGGVGYLTFGPAHSWRFSGNVATTEKEGKRITVEFLIEQAP